MNESYLISVIVPIYKVEQYLPLCIDSLINQSYKNLEIILIDDGSPDSCPLICDNYAYKDNRIKVIHKTNGGLSSARNAGLDIATGNFIAFVDSDDYLEPEMYKTLLNLLLSTNSDIAVCDFFYYDGKAKTSDSKNTSSIVVLNKVRDFYAHILDPNPTLRFEVWNKLFRKSVINEIRFKIGQVYEDVYFDKNVFQNANKIAHIEKPLYIYRTSRLGNSNSSFGMNRLTVFDEIDEYITYSKEVQDRFIEERFKIFGAETSISLHYLATIHDADESLKIRLLEHFEKYYQLCDVKTIRHKIFHYSPKVFRILSRLKSLSF